MKKIIALFVMLFAFSVNINAQDKSKIEEAAKKDIELLKKSIQLDEQKEKDVYRLFVKKHKELASPGAEERKKDINNTIEAKLKATFGDDVIDQLKKKDAKSFSLLVGN